MEGMGCLLSTHANDSVVLDNFASDTESLTDVLHNDLSLTENGITSVDAIGQGTWGTVFLVRKDATGEILAAKHVSKVMTITWDGLQFAPKTDRLLDEIRALLVLKGEHHCISLKGVLESPSVLTLLTDYIDGGDLMQHVAESSQKGAFHEAHAARLMRQLFDAVAHCHDRGVCHRDIKPDNILINKAKDAITLCDFGSATLWSPARAHRAADPPMKGEFGSPFYTAPEVNFGNVGGGYDRLCDVFSAGLTSFVVVAGFPSDPEHFWNCLHNVRYDNTSMRYFAETLSSSFFEFLAWTAAWDSAKRPEAQEVLATLGGWLDLSEKVGKPDTPLASSGHVRYLVRKDLMRSIDFVISSSLPRSDIDALAAALAAAATKPTPMPHVRSTMPSLKYIVTVETLLAALQSIGHCDVRNRIDQLSQDHSEVNRSETKLDLFPIFDQKVTFDDAIEPTHPQFDYVKGRNSSRKSTSHWLVPKLGRSRNHSSRSGEMLSRSCNGALPTPQRGGMLSRSCHGHTQLRQI